MRRFLLAGLLLAACSSKQKNAETEPPTTPTNETETVTKEEPVKPEDAATGWKARLADIDKLEFHFQDSSVPPQYHRSYTITVTAERIDKVVDSYGDIVSEQGNAITAEQFKGLLDALGPLGIDKAPPANSMEPGCSGGTSKSLSLHAGSEALLKATRYSCGGDADGALIGDIEGLGKAVHALLVPSTDAPSE